jgi:hypothetical protein
LTTIGNFDIVVMKPKAAELESMQSQSGISKLPPDMLRLPQGAELFFSREAAVIPPQNYAGGLILIERNR